MVSVVVREEDLSNERVVESDMECRPDHESSLDGPDTAPTERIEETQWIATELHGVPDGARARDSWCPLHLITSRPILKPVDPAVRGLGIPRHWLDGE